ncbi:MAG: hypothetical protein JSS82_14615 [Bacteroidetes bacterium]|nr:hypothetical protein [Bacteroidota bacterium]
MTDEDFKRLESKIDTLSAKVEKINQKFEQAIVVAKYGNSFTPPKQKSKKEIDEERHAHIKRRVDLMFKGRQLQRQFNLVMPPHYSRVEHYLRTNDPKAFDGLKRNS